MVNIRNHFAGFAAALGRRASPVQAADANRLAVARRKSAAAGTDGKPWEKIILKNRCKPAAFPL